MNKNDLEANPFPSYIHVDGFEIYVAYPGQKLTCKYCGEKEHFQAKCDKRIKRFNDFPQLEKQSNDHVIFQNKPHSDKTEFDLGKEKQFPEKSVNLSKKRKLARTDSNVDLTNLKDEAACNHTILSDKPDCSIRFW